MKLTNIKLTNFLIHDDAEFDCDRVTIINGRNALGKSSVRDAIEFALRGLARDLRYKKDASALARDGAKSGKVSLDILANGDSGTLTRTTGGKSNWPDAQIEQAAGNAEFVRLLSDPFRIIHLDCEARQKVFGRLGQKPVDLLAYIKAHWSQLDEAMKCGVTLKLIAAETDLDGAIKEVIAKRRECKAVVKSIDTKPPEVPEVETRQGKRPVTDLPLDAVTGELSKLTTKRDELVKTYGHLTLTSPEDIEAEIAEVQEIVTQAADAEERLPKIDGAIEVCAKKLKAATITLDNCQTDRSDLKARIDVAKETIKVFATTGTKHEKAVCVASIEIECPLGKKGQKDVIKAQKELLATWEKEMPGIQKDYDGAESAVKDLQAEAAELRGRRDETQREIERGPKVLKELERLEAQKKSFDKLDEANAEIDQLTERIDKGQAIVQAAAAYETARKSHDKLQEDARASEHAAELWDSLEKFLSGDARAYIAEAAKSATMPEDLMKRWGITVEIESDGNIYYTEANSRRLIEMCSRSEQYRAGVVLQAALSLNSGAGWMVLDEAEILDSQAMSGLLAWALGETGVESLILIGMSEKPVPERLPQGVAYHRLGGQ